MNKIKDIIYSIDVDFYNTINRDKFDVLKRDIEFNGYYGYNIKGYIIKIFNPQLAFFFMLKKLPAFNTDTKKETEINVGKYLSTYFTGYKKGEEYFIKNYDVPAQTLYGENADVYVNDLNDKYFHTPIDGGMYKGWVSIAKHTYPTTFNHKIFDKIGFYSGLVNKLIEKVKKYPLLFKKFEKSIQNTKNESKSIENLKQFFKCTSEYTKVMNLLASEGYINRDSHTWIDEKKGNKEFLVKLIKNLHQKGYLKSRPKNKEIKLICKNTFAIEVSIHTINRAKPDTGFFGFIKPFNKNS